MPRDDDEPEESSTVVLITIVCASLGAILAQTSVCADRHACLNAGTCIAIDSDIYGSCAFKTSLTPSFYKMLNGTNRGALPLIQRGVCQFGLMEEISANNALVCRRKRLYPNALSWEISSSNETSDHRSWCGRWIDAATPLFETVRWAFFDEGVVRAAVDDVFSAKSVASLAISNVLKFRSACRTMISTSSVGPASIEAYKMLMARLQNGQTSDSLLEDVGALASFYCDAPAGVGLTLSGDKFAASVFNGAVLSSGLIDEALYVVGADRARREMARTFADRAANAESWELNRVGESAGQRIFYGSHAGTWVDTLMGPAISVSVDVFVPSLERFFFATEQLTYSHAHAYTSGVAAACALTSRKITTGEFGALSVNATKASALGRSAPPERDKFTKVGNEQIREASRAGLSALLPTLADAQLNNFGSASAARSSCARVAKVIFPEQTDAVVYKTLVSAALYDRLQTITATIRTAVADTLREDLIGRIFSTQYARDNAISKVLNMHVGIPGAPEGTWGGRSRSFRQPVFKSSDGALVIMLKQANSVFLDRAASVVSQEGLAALSPLYAADQRNAYLLLGSSDAVAAILPGLIVPPFADELYDDESLLSRVGFVIAHELGHVTAFASEWDSQYADELLGEYPASTRVEAIADLTAAAALMRVGVPRDAVCAHQSQIWCARTGQFTAPAYGSHPPPNMRGDLICRFLRTHFK